MCRDDRKKRKDQKNKKKQKKTMKVETGSEREGVGLVKGNRRRRFRMATTHSSYTTNYQIYFDGFVSCRAFKWNRAGALQI